MTTGMFSGVAYSITAWAWLLFVSDGSWILQTKNTGMGLNEPGLHHMIQTGYDLLDLVTFFTVGGAENRAWTIRQNSRAPQAAGTIHSDFERGFIRAVVYNFDDLVKYKNENAVKEAGKLRLEGKDYVVQDGDIIHFRFNV
jgi:hypothetical protein